MVRYWNNNGAFEEVEMPFNIYYTLSQKNKSLLVDLILYLMILYDTKDIKLKIVGIKDIVYLLNLKIILNLL